MTKQLLHLLLPESRSGIWI